MIVIALFYVLALNPYLGPGIFDDVVYLGGAESLAKGDGYYFNGQMIGDWPPFFSIILALPIYLGLPAIISAKIIVLIFVFLSLLIMNQLMLEEEWEYRIPVLLLFALAPTGLIWGSRIMSDWLFVCLVFTFLLLLKRSENRPIWGKWTWLAGICFGLAFLTRYAGLFLSFPLAAQAFLQISRGLQFFVSRVIIGLMGLSIFIVFWIFPVQHAMEQRTANVGYFGSIQKILEKINFDFVELMNVIVAYMTSIKLPSEFPKSIGIVITAVLVIVMLVGLYQKYAKKGIVYSDFWVFGLLFVYLAFYDKIERYFLPVGPFLFYYAILGMEKFLSKRVLSGVLFVWIAIFIIIDGYILVKGNGRTYSGLNYLASPTPESFYRGYWKDLYEVSQEIKSDSEIKEVIFKGPDLLGKKYIFFFTGKKIDEEGQANFTSDTILMDASGQVPEGFNTIYQNPSFVLLYSHH